MNYLTLCDTLIKEAGLDETGVLSVVGQSSIKKKVVTWVNRAWVEIQNKRDWNFLWQEGSFNTVVDSQTYDPVGDMALSPALRRWDTSSFIHSTSGSSKFYLQYIPWESFDNTLSSSGTPTQFTVKPNKFLKFNSVPDVIGTVDFSYIRTPQTLSANTDTPLLDSAYHDIILYQAMLYLAAEQDASELYQDAHMQLTARLADLSAEFLPNTYVAHTPLA
jgi:hypothetical protein